MDEDAFLPGQFAFDNPLRLVGNERCQMLDRHIFLPAEATADELVLNDDFFLGKSQEERRFPPRVIGALIGRIDIDAIVKGHGYGTFRFQESMFRPGRFIMAGHFILRGRNDRVGIAAHQMFVDEDIGPVGRMDQRSSLCQCFSCRCNGL